MKCVLKRGGGDYVASTYVGDGGSVLVNAATDDINAAMIFEVTYRSGTLRGDLEVGPTMPREGVAEPSFEIVPVSVGVREI